MSSLSLRNSHNSNERRKEEEAKKMTSVSNEAAPAISAVTLDPERVLAGLLGKKIGTCSAVKYMPSVNGKSLVLVYDNFSPDEIGAQFLTLPKDLKNQDVVFPLVFDVLHGVAYADSPQGPVMFGLDYSVFKWPTFQVNLESLDGESGISQLRERISAPCKSAVLGMKFPGYRVLSVYEDEDASEK